MTEIKLYQIQIFNLSYSIHPFYVTEGPFMHLTVCCRFLICCVWGGGQVGKVSGTYDPVFRVMKYGPWIYQLNNYVL